MYVNDLPKCLEYCTPRMFADDTTLTVSSKSIHDILSVMNMDLNNVKDWLMANKYYLLEIHACSNPSPFHAN